MNTSNITKIGKKAFRNIAKEAVFRLSGENMNSVIDMIAMATSKEVNIIK